MSFSIQTVNGIKFGDAYMSALGMELKRREGDGADLEKCLNEHGLYQMYLDGDYFEVPWLYLEHRLNVKAIIHRMELWGYVETGKVYDDPRYAEALKGYPIQDNPEDGDCWVALILSNPSQVSRCQWKLLDGWNWAELLARMPQFAEHCDWGKFDDYAWAYLLTSTDAFDTKCDFSIFTSVDWVYLVKRRPDLVSHLDWKILTDRDEGRIKRILNG